MLYTLRSRLTEEKGFTLIELLVVILIIGILAAIALPSFLGQRDKATDTQAKTAVRTAATAMETRFTDSRTYAGATVAELREIEPSLNQPPANGANLTIPVVAADNYRVQVASPTGATFSVVHNATTGATTRPCTRPATNPGRSGCPASLNW